MKIWKIVGVLALVAVLALSSVGSALSSPALQQEGEKVGLFGTVVVIEGLIIKLDTGKEVETTADTGFHVPGLDTAGLENISVGDRLSILALQEADGSLTALQVVVIPGEPANNSHIIGVVTDTENGIITITDAQGNSFTLELPQGAPPVDVGGFLTVVSSRGETGQLSPRAVERIEDVIDRLLEDIDRAVGRAVDHIRSLVESNTDHQLAGLENALQRAQRANERAYQALETALQRASSRHDEIIETASNPGQYEGGEKVKYEGTIASFTDTTLVLDDGTTLTINDDTRIRGTLVIGAEVEVKGVEIDENLIALKIEVKGDEEEYEGEFSGIVASFSDTELVFEDGSTFVINDDTEIEGLLYPGAEVDVEATASDGSLIATNIELEEEPEAKSEYEGAVASFSDTELVLVGGTTYVINDATKIDGTLYVGAEVKVKAVTYDSTLYALKIKVSELEFEGIVASFSDTELILEDGTTYVINDDTRIKGTLTIGAEVEVEAIVSNGDFIATEIEVGEYEGGLICADEITSNINQNIEVESGATCTIKNGATVTGNIKVGSTLVVTDASSVVGNIKGEDGASITVEDNSSVSGNIKHEGGSGDVTVSNSAVDGNVKGEGVDTMTITGSTIGSDVELEGGGTLVITEASSVGGDVEGEDGASITVEGNSSVEGEVKNEGGSGDLTITDSHVGDDVETEGVDTVTITDSVIDGDIESEGDGTVTITGNTVGGDIEAEGDTVTITDNDVGGDIESEDNGTLTITGNTVGGYIETEVVEEGEYVGTVFDFSSTHLQLNDENGPTFTINQETDIDSALYEGAYVEVEAVTSNGDLIATEIEVGDTVESGHVDDDHDDGDNNDDEDDDDND